MLTITILINDFEKMGEHTYLMMIVIDVQSCYQYNIYHTSNYTFSNTAIHSRKSFLDLKYCLCRNVKLDRVNVKMCIITLSR